MPIKIVGNVPGIDMEERAKISFCQKRQSAFPVD
jgi:hypothetical protein